MQDDKKEKVTSIVREIGKDPRGPRHGMANLIFALEARVEQLERKVPKKGRPKKNAGGS